MALLDLADLDVPIEWARMMFVLQVSQINTRIEPTIDLLLLLTMLP